jgi:hypothetical protein
VGRGGIEHQPEMSEKGEVMCGAGAESGARPAVSDSDLTEVMLAWPKLSADVRARVVRIIRAVP